ncbi:hypothetical protein [Paenibacillus alvei]|uniref:hypothetical protein n=1 Tax=Paenibacillus alvei TaxID=44250 RepID=UPI0013D94208|nr:hypothetical protein [Paenibacillus alvei]NEZ45466.1 hypothetical protein [Paenibacillus alvei]
MTYYPPGMVYYNNHPSPTVLPPKEYRRSIDLSPTNASNISDLGNGFYLYRWGKQVFNPKEYSTVYLHPYDGHKVISAGYDSDSAAAPITFLSNYPLTTSIWSFWLVNTSSINANVSFHLISKA